jgi:hypothetical protein
MNISELFGELEEKELNGEINLVGNCINWSYDLHKNSEEIEVLEYDDDDDEIFMFESESSEELLNDAYDNDLKTIQEFIEENDELDEWTFLEPEINNNIISFKVF